MFVAKTQAHKLEKKDWQSRHVEMWLTMWSGVNEKITPFMWSLQQERRPIDDVLSPQLPLLSMYLECSSMHRVTLSLHDLSHTYLSESVILESYYKYGNSRTAVKHSWVITFTKKLEDFKKDFNMGFIMSLIQITVKYKELELCCDGWEV